MKFKKGFTLIELLVVIAIIGVLSSVVLASLNKARSKARDAQRLSDIKQLVTVIEMYHSENGLYPTCTGANTDYCTTTGASSYGNLTTLQVVPNYIKNIPLDPINTNSEYGYYYARLYKPNSTNTGYVYTGSNQNYIVATRLENSSNSTFSGWNNSSLNLIKGQ